MAFILNIETATDVCSICVSREGEILSVREIMGNNHVSQITLLIEACLKDANLGMRDLAAVAISDGPGSYTSLRIGAATAKGICYAMDIPLIAVDTLESLALESLRLLRLKGEGLVGAVEESVLEEKREGYMKNKTNNKTLLQTFICPMVDARRMEVYTSLFEIKASVVEGGEDEMMVVEPLQALVVDGNSFSSYFDRGAVIHFCGNGAEKCRSVLPSPLAAYDSIVCSAQYLVPLSRKAYMTNHFVSVAYHTPRYYKEPNITSSKK